MSIFKNRECFTLETPLSNKSELENLSKIPFNKLNPTFLEQFSEFKLKIFKTCQSKFVHGIEFDGSTIIKLITNFVEEINKESIPNMSNFIESLIENKIVAQFEKAKDYFFNQMKQLESSSISNFENCDFYRNIQQIKEKAKSILNEFKKLGRDKLKANNLFSNQISILEKLMEENESNIIQKRNLDTETYSLS